MFKYHGVQLLDYMITSMYSLINCQTFFQHDYHFESSPAMHESFALSLSLTAFDVVSVLDFDYFNRCVMLSYFYFNFHFLLTYDVKYLFIRFIKGLPRWRFPSGALSKQPTCKFRRHNRYGFDTWVRKIPLEEDMSTSPSILA